MDYTRLLQRAFEIVRNHLWLIILGTLVALSGGTGSGGSGFNFRFNGGDGGDFGFPGGMPGMPEGMPRTMPGMPPFDPGGMPNFDQFRPFMGLTLAAIGILGVLAILVGIVFWVIATVARGSLVTAVDEIETTGNSSFGAALQAGIDRIWTLLGIAIIPAIPGVILFAAGLGGVASYFTIFRVMGDGARAPLGAGFGLAMLALVCIVAPIALILGILSTLANRACMLEGTGVIDSYRRSFEVISANLGPAIVLFVIQIAIGIVVGIALLVPGLLMALCFLFWPVLLLINGAVSTYFSTLWTLAWREWTGRAATVPSPGTV